MSLYSPLAHPRGGAYGAQAPPPREKKKKGEKKERKKKKEKEGEKILVP